MNMLAALYGAVLGLHASVSKVSSMFIVCYFFLEAIVWKVYFWVDFQKLFRVSIYPFTKIENAKQNCKFVKCNQRNFF